MTLTPYDLPFEPEEYGDFEWIDDRDDLADLPLDLEPCDWCGNEFSVRGAFGRRVVLECRTCRMKWYLEDEEEPWDDWDEEDEEEAED